MKITAVYDRQGKILAAAIVDDDMSGPIPQASKGSKAATFEVPQHLRDLGLHELCSGHRIDAKKTQLVEMKQSTKAKSTRENRSRRR
jgi:hypothetical protein